MPPKKDGKGWKPAATKSSSSQTGSAETMKKEIEELKKENEALKFQVAKLEENFDFTKVTKKMGISAQDMTHMMLEENTRLLAKVLQLESSNNNSSSQTSAEGKSEELEKMKQQIEQKDKEIDDLRSRQKKFDSDISQLKGQLKEKASSQTSAEGGSEELEKMKQQIEQKDKEMEIKDEVKAKTQALKDKEKEISDKESVIKQLQDTKSGENNNKDSGSSEASLKKELEAAKRKFVDLEVKMNNIETTNNEITQNRKSLEKEIKEKDKDIIDLKKKLSASESKLEDLKVEIAANRKSLQKEIIELNKKLSASERKSFEKEIKEKDKDLTELKKKLSASERLSKMMGDQITENNPDIADLSDLNRPTKLAEKYSELYDNEWTDCYEEMENNSMNTNDILGELFGILKDIYLFSQKVSYDYENNVKSSALTIPGIQRRPETSKLNSSTRKQLVDLRKTFAPQLASDFFKLYLQKCKENTDGRPKTKKFMNLCAEICWLMSVQDPPVVFEFEEPKGGFDKEKYKYYTKSGTQMDFIVWPPMKLHQTGPLLAKGVAQAK